VAAVLLGLSGAAGSARGAALGPGDLDPSFGSGGAVITSLSSGPDYVVQASDAAVEPDGVIVVAGTYAPNGDAPVPPEPVQPRFVVAAFDPNGQPDVAFGSAGILEGPPGSVGNSIAVAPDGELFIGAVVERQNAVLALNADGSTDTSFGTNGTAMISDAQPLGTGGDGVGLDVQRDGKILFTGQTFTTTSCCGRDFVERLDTSGRVDTTFGQGGRTVLGAPGLESDPPLAQTTNGDIVISGGSPGVLDRLLPNGHLDPSFGHHGRITTTTPLIRALTLQRDGKILIGGQSLPTSAPVLSRLEPDGSPDTSFGRYGTLTAKLTPGDAGAVTAVAVQPDGAISFAGGTVVGRVNRDGTADLGFGSRGAQALPAGTFDPGTCGDHCAPFDAVTNLKLLPDGDLLAVGQISQYSGVSAGPETLDLLIARVLGGGPAEPIVSHVRFTHWRHRQPATISAIRFKLSTAAHITITLETKTPGRESHGTCVARTRTACARDRRLGSLKQRSRPPGENTIALPRSIHGHRIPDGSLAVVITATNIAGTSNGRYTQR
jgi:uncharacterized delta-60 repeat protein